MSQRGRVFAADASIDFRLVRPVAAGENAQDTRAFDVDFPSSGMDEEDPAFAEFEEAAAEAHFLSPQLAAAVGAAAPLNEATRFHKRLSAVRQMTGMAVRSTRQSEEEFSNKKEREELLLGSERLSLSRSVLCLAVKGVRAEASLCD